MGCDTSRLPIQGLETSCRFIIKTMAENLNYSRDNIKLFEPAFYLFNTILEKVVREKKNSNGLIKALTSFQLDLTPMLQENPFPEGNFIKLVVPVQKEFQKIFPEIKFDMETKMKAIDNISNTLDKLFLKDFFLNEPALFWNKNFAQKEEVSWEGFLEKFDLTYQDFFEKEFAFLSEEKKQNLKNIKENLPIMMKYFLETNNDHKITKDGWNVFTFKKMFDFDSRWRFIEDLANVPSPTRCLENKLILTYFLSDEEVLENPVEYHISQNGIDLNGFDKTRNTIDMSNDFVKFGRKNDNHIRMIPEGVSRNHFLLSMKKVLKENQLINEYFVNNISQVFFYFCIEAGGYLLAQNSIISLNNAKQFYVKNMHPPYKPNKSYLSIEPEYTEGKRKPPSSNLALNTRPFIEIEFYNDNLNKTYEVTEDNKDLVVSIGSGTNDTLQIHEMDENNEDLISKNHCSLKYDSAKKCWIIIDENTKDFEGKLFYKTLMKSHLQGQYGGYEGGIINRGIKLVHGMKLSIANNVISVEEKQ